MSTHPRPPKPRFALGTYEPPRVVMRPSTLRLAERPTHGTEIAFRLHGIPGAEPAELVTFHLVLELERASGLAPRRDQRVEVYSAALGRLLDASLPATAGPVARHREHGFRR